LARHNFLQQRRAGGPEDILKPRLHGNTPRPHPGSSQTKSQREVIVVTALAAHNKRIPVGMPPLNNRSIPGKVRQRGARQPNQHVAAERVHLGAMKSDPGTQWELAGFRPVGA